LPGVPPQFPPAQVPVQVQALAQVLAPVVVVTEGAFPLTFSTSFYYPASFYCLLVSSEA
jgi:hypothetical protein